MKKTATYITIYMTDWETGNALDLTMAIIEVTTMIYGLTRQCFTGDTLVATEEGNKAIKDIRVGDYVYSYDVESDTRPAMGSQVEKLLHFQICHGTNNQEIQLEQEELEIT